jgi:hypothetical protein
MNSISRSVLARSLMAGTASLAILVIAPAIVRADIVIVTGTDGSAGGNGSDGGDGESVAANAGNVTPVTDPLNRATANGGAGGPGGLFVADGVNGG